MTKTPALPWLDLPAAVELARRKGFLPGQSVQEAIRYAVTHRGVPLRVRGVVCPPGSLHELVFDFDGGGIRGWPGNAGMVTVVAGGSVYRAGPTADPPTPCEIGRIELGTALDALHEAEAPAEGARRTGRTPGRAPKWRWADATLAGSMYVVAHGVPDTYRPIFQAIQAHFADHNDGQTPDEKEMRDLAQRIRDAAKAALRS